MSSFHVRSATSTDVDTVVDFQCLMARETEGRELDRARVTRGVAAVLGGEGDAPAAAGGVASVSPAGPARGWYLLAESAGVVVASLLVTFEWSDWRAGWFWWIQSVYVVAPERGRGVYRALYEEVLRRAAEAGDVCGVRLYVELENERAQAVYERLGMQRAHYHIYEVDFVLGAGS